MLTDRVAIVTGGGRGIGRAICVRLAQEGAKVVFSYAGNDEAAAETVCLCGGSATAIRADVTDAEAVRRLIEAAAAFGRIDILVNNAGITRDNLLLRMKDADFDRVIETNLKGTFLCMRAVARQMLKQRAGRIVNVSSVVALRGNAGQTNYCASKAGVIGMSKAAARELAGRGVTVNVIAPGFIETDMTAGLPEQARADMAAQIPLARMGTPEDVAAAVAFLVSDNAAYITGQVLCVDCGMAM